MYIPVMAFVTYILLSTLLAGLRGAFHPEVMGLTATAAFAVVAVEILGLKFGTYILSISNDSQLLDLVAYSGYKFVGVIVTLVVAEILNGGKGTGGWVGWTVFTYTFLANAFFLVSSAHSFFFPLLSIYLAPHLPHPLSLSLPILPILLKAQQTKIPPAPFPQIRPPSRFLLVDPSRRHANRRPRLAEPTNAIPLPLQLRGAIRLHVGAQQAGFCRRKSCRHKNIR